MTFIQTIYPETKPTIMHILNLTDPTKSAIQFTVTKFPDGQQQINIEDVGFEEGITIKSRLNNFMDLELLICARKALRNSGYLGDIHLYAPYILGTRSDRHFGGCSTNYLRDVICPILRSLNFDTITVLDPHSDVLEACLPNLIKVDNSELVRFALKDLYKDRKMDFILLAPDAGATKKIGKVAENIGFKGDILTCSKERGPDGKLTRTTVPLWPKNEGNDFIIIDDICDGGATFLNIAEQLDDYHNAKRIYLIITHGIFSKGFGALADQFNGIYCTNSYKDFYVSDAPKAPEILKQLNIF